MARRLSLPNSVYLFWAWYRSSPRSLSYASSHSIKLSALFSGVQILVILRPTGSISLCHCRSVRSLAARSTIITRSRDVACQWAPVSGMTFSLISTLLYPGVIAETSWDRIFWQVSSFQSWRIEWRKYTRAPGTVVSGLMTRQAILAAREGSS